MEYYILFEEAEDSYYGDIIKGDALFTLEQKDEFVRVNASKIVNENGPYFYSDTLVKDDYGTGLYYFRRFTTSDDITHMFTNASGSWCTPTKEDAEDSTKLFESIPRNVAIDLPKSWATPSREDMENMTKMFEGVATNPNRKD